MRFIPTRSSHSPFACSRHHARPAVSVTLLSPRPRSYCVVSGDYAPCSRLRRVFSRGQKNSAFARTKLDCAQLTTWAETAATDWGTLRPESDNSQLKRDSSELGRYKIRRVERLQTGGCGSINVGHHIDGTHAANSRDHLASCPREELRDLSVHEIGIVDI